MIFDKNLSTDSFEDKYHKLLTPYCCDEMEKYTYNYEFNCEPEQEKIIIGNDLWVKHCPWCGEKIRFMTENQFNEGRVQK